ncbi:MAG: hypothetical protein ACJA0U_001571 [Salibacteraceae bacterium]|jgi:uncharacterized protein (TIGR01777 family)
MKVLIAGGTGLIGSHLSRLLVQKGHQVKLLSRRPSEGPIIHWDPALKELDSDLIQDTEIVVNLCGAGIADKRWSTKRKKELLESRVLPAQFLFEHRESMPSLKHYISASGISCYGFEMSETPFNEEDAYGQDYTSQLVRQWEEAADEFKADYLLTKIRIAVVLTKEGGALKTMRAPIKVYFGAAISPGTQLMQWIHIDDLCAAFLHSIEDKLEGTYNTLGNNSTNKEVMVSLAKSMNKPMWLPPVPKFMLKLLFGELADILINGVEVSNEKLKNTNFKIEHTEIQEAINSLR